MKGYGLPGLLMIILALGACATPLPESVDDMPDIGIPLEKMNEKIKLYTPEGWNIGGFKIGEDVSIAVEVISDDQIAFNHSYGARLFIYKNLQWIEVANFMK
jgi:hypothetical protein